MTDLISSKNIYQSRCTRLIPESKFDCVMSVTINILSSQTIKNDRPLKGDHATNAIDGRICHVETKPCITIGG